MTNILKHGTYRVGFKENAKSVHDLISVMLSQRYQKIRKVNYTLDELRDLESKLVLICGNNAENRAEVDHYLNVSIFFRGKIISKYHIEFEDSYLTLSLARALYIALSVVHIFKKSYHTL